MILFHKKNLSKSVAVRVAIILQVAKMSWVFL